MSDIALSVLVSRTELALAALQLQDRPAGYRIIRDSLGPGAVLWRRQAATSPYVHGEVLIGAVKEHVTAALGVWVEGATQSELSARIATVLRAFEQFRYTVTVAIDDTTYEWDCEPADAAVGDGGGFQALHLMSKIQAVRLVIPRHPIPVAGPT